MVSQIRGERAFLAQVSLSLLCCLLDAYRDFFFHFCSYDCHNDGIIIMIIDYYHSHYYYCCYYQYCCCFTVIIIVIIIIIIMPTTTPHSDQLRRLPVLHSSMLGLEISLGRDQTIDFDDFLNGLCLDMVDTYTHYVVGYYSLALKRLGL
jgi:hypothetical protein